MDLARFFASEFDQHQETVRATRDALAEPFSRLVEVCVSSLDQGGKVLFFGNGGSAGDAQHLATELAARYITNRTAIASIALTTDSSLITAIGNDLGFERVFARQIEALGKPGDVAIGISTSGKSVNVTQGLKQARDMGLVGAAFTGRDGGDLVGLADPVLIVPSDTTSRIQEMHITLGQMLCGAIEIELGHVAEPTL